MPGPHHPDCEKSPNGFIVAHKASWNSWRAMKSRCRNPNDENFHLYGGRGISFCPKWESFVGFVEDMGDRPASLTLERLDNDKNYCLENCCWATARQQRLNQRWRTKLNPDKVQQIRDMYARGAFQKDIAALFGIAQAHVSVVVLRKQWN